MGYCLAEDHPVGDYELWQPQDDYPRGVPAATCCLQVEVRIPEPDAAYPVIETHIC